MRQAWCEGQSPHDFVVALAGAGITALVVNTAFAARFDHYLHTQQRAQLAGLSAAVGRAYAGQGNGTPARWPRSSRRPARPPSGSAPRPVMTCGSGTVTR